LDAIGLRNVRNARFGLVFRSPFTVYRRSERRKNNLPSLCRSGERWTV